MVHARTHNVWEVETRESKIQCYSQLNSEFEVIMGYRKFCFKQGNKNGVMREGWGEREKGRGEDLVDIREGHRTGAFHPRCGWDLMC